MADGAQVLSLATTTVATPYQKCTVDLVPVLSYRSLTWKCDHVIRAQLQDLDNYKVRERLTSTSQTTNVL